MLPPETSFGLLHALRFLGAASGNDQLVRQLAFKSKMFREESGSGIRCTVTFDPVGKSAFRVSSELCIKRVHVQMMRFHEDFLMESLLGNSELLSPSEHLLFTREAGSIHFTK